MNKLTKIIIFSLMLGIFLATMGLMLWLSLRPEDNVDNYKHISYTTWASDKTYTHDTYSVLKVDEASGSILATSTAKGTYVIDASTNIVQHLTLIDSKGMYTNDLIKGLSGTKGALDITFGSISSDANETHLGVWATLSILSLGSMTALLYILKTMFNKKKNPA